eukprot:3814404-Rhodomonas_salina.1
MMRTSELERMRLENEELKKKVHGGEFAHEGERLAGTKRGSDEISSKPMDIWDEFENVMMQENGLKAFELQKAFIAENRSHSGKNRHRGAPGRGHALPVAPRRHADVVGPVVPTAVDLRDRHARGTEHAHAALERQRGVHAR